MGAVNAIVTQPHNNYDSWDDDTDRNNYIWIIHEWHQHEGLISVEFKGLWMHM